MMFTGKEKHIVKIEDARLYIENFRETAPKGSVFAGFFGKLSILAILNQPDCVGLRYYNGRNAAGIDQLVLIGVKEDGSEIVDGHVASLAVPCPPSCGNPPSLL